MVLEKGNVSDGCDDVIVDAFNLLHPFFSLWLQIEIRQAGRKDRLESFVCEFMSKSL